PDKENDLIDDKGPSNGCNYDLHPLPEYDQDIKTPYSSSKLLDQQASNILSFQKPITYSWPQHDQGTIVPTPKPQYVHRTTPPTSIGSHKTNNGVVNYKAPSNSFNCDLHPLVALSQGLVIHFYFEKNLDEPAGICSFDGTIANPWHEHGTIDRLLCRSFDDLTKSIGGPCQGSNCL
ncbi:hypothetical protein HAX54_004545, partial [Datura stramonium]|nr:hypothetical protein [Datura stramonium]